MTYQISTQFIRWFASGFIAVQSTIALTIISEFVLPNLSDAQAQESHTDAAAAVYRKASPAVVFVQTDRGSGSGVIVESNGLIVTSAHLLENAKWATVELSDGRKFSPRLISMGGRNCLDLALLKIEGTRLPKVNLASQDSIHPGQHVFAIGYPRGIKPPSITQGIVSNIHPERGFLQIDASINPGNSGGALLNSQGELIGINSFRSRDDQGLNFAVAASKVQRLLQAMREEISPVIGQYLIPVNAPQTKLIASLLPMNETQHGRLQGTDHLLCDGSRADLYTFHAEANQPILLKMSSSEMDSFLMLLGSDGTVLGKGTSTNPNRSAHVLVNLPRRGAYTVVVNSVRPKQLGRYQLQASTPLMVEQSTLTSADLQLKDGSLYRASKYGTKACK